MKLEKVVHLLLSLERCCRGTVHLSIAWKKTTRQHVLLLDCWKKSMHTKANLPWRNTTLQSSEHSWTKIEENEEGVVSGKSITKMIKELLSVCRFNRLIPQNGKNNMRLILRALPIVRWKAVGSKQKFFFPFGVCGEMFMGLCLLE